MHFIDRSHLEPRWAGYVRLAAGGVFAALFCAVVAVDIFLLPANDALIGAISVPVRDCGIGAPCAGPAGSPSAAHAGRGSAPSAPASRPLH